MTVYNETGKFVTRIYLSSRLVKCNKNILPEAQNNNSFLCEIPQSRLAVFVFTTVIYTQQPSLCPVRQSNIGCHIVGSLW